MLKEKFKKYRALGVIATGMVFNLVESIMFAQNGNPFNLKPLSIGEWICDIIATLIFLFGLMLMTYDIWKYKPKKTITCKLDEGKIIEVTEKE